MAAITPHRLLAHIRPVCVVIEDATSIFGASLISPGLASSTPETSVQFLTGGNAGLRIEISFDFSSNKTSKLIMSGQTTMLNVAYPTGMNHGAWKQTRRQRPFMAANLPVACPRPRAGSELFVMEICTELPFVATEWLEPSPGTNIDHPAERARSDLKNSLLRLRGRPIIKILLMWYVATVVSEDGSSKAHLTPDVVRIWRQLQADDEESVRTGRLVDIRKVTELVVNFQPNQSSISIPAISPTTMRLDGTYFSRQHWLFSYASALWRQWIGEVEAARDFEDAHFHISGVKLPAIDRRSYTVADGLETAILLISHAERRPIRVRTGDRVLFVAGRGGGRYHGEVLERTSWQERWEVLLRLVPSAFHHQAPFSSLPDRRLDFVPRDLRPVSGTGDDILRAGLRMEQPLHGTCGVWLPGLNARRMLQIVVELSGACASDETDTRPDGLDTWKQSLVDFLAHRSSIAMVSHPLISDTTLNDVSFSQDTNYMKVATGLQSFYEYNGMIVGIIEGGKGYKKSLLIVRALLAAMVLPSNTKLLRNATPTIHYYAIGDETMWKVMDALQDMPQAADSLRRLLSCRALEQHIEWDDFRSVIFSCRHRLFSHGHPDPTAEDVPSLLARLSSSYKEERDVLALRIAIRAVVLPELERRNNCVRNRRFHLPKASLTEKILGEMCWGTDAIGRGDHAFVDTEWGRNLLVRVGIALFGSAAELEPALAAVEPYWKEGAIAVLKAAAVLVTTPTAALDDIYRTSVADVVVIDDANQCSIPQLMSAIYRSRPRVILLTGSRSQPSAMPLGTVTWDATYVDVGSSAMRAFEAHGV